MKLSDAMQNL